MYLYIYDSYLNNKKYEITLNKIEARLSDLGINGRIAKMTILKNMKETIEDGIKKGVETVVAVGNDQTLFDVIRIVAGQPIIVGYIPVGAKSKIANFLDIPAEEKACDVLSARLSERVDIGKINNHYFLSSVEVEQGEVSIECDGRYWITPKNPKNSVQICNFDHITQTGKNTFSNPQDGRMEVVIKPAGHTKGFFGFTGKVSNKGSIFPVRRLKIVSQAESVPVAVDGENVAKTPVTIEVVPRKLNIIVGKKRMF